MEFPITRERLQTYMTGEYNYNAIKNDASVIITIKQFKRDVEHHVRMGRTSFVYNFNCITGGIKWHDSISKKEIRNYVVSEIKKILPDCTLTMDPLETYMIIDWS